MCADDWVVIDENLDGHARPLGQRKCLAAEGEARHVHGDLERPGHPFGGLPQPMVVWIAEVEVLRRPSGLRDGSHEVHGVVRNLPHLNREEVEKRGVGLGNVDGSLTARHEGRSEVERDLLSREHRLHNRGEHHKGKQDSRD